MTDRTGATETFRGLDGWSPAILRQRLSQADYRTEPLRELGLGNVNRIVSDRAIVSPMLDDASLLTLAIRLFLLGETLAPEQALRLLGPGIGELESLGLVRFENGRVRSRVQIYPQGPGWVACDFLERQHDPSGDYVMGLGPSSQLLASLAPPCPAGDVLELGCGIGWLSQRYRQSGARVVATDVNPRALDFARFNARLSGVEGIDFRSGDLFRPVAGERFDVIVANLPYVQSPGGDLVFRESPAGGENICLRALRELGDHLNPGGIGIALINWCHTRDDEWEEVPLRWAPETGLRRWLFQTDCASPAEYARRWIQGDPRFDAEGRVAEFARWMEFYRSEGIRCISSGFLAVQACDPGEEWTDTESRAVERITRGAGRELARTMANRSWLRRFGGPLLDRSFRPVAGIRAHAEMELDDQQAWQRRTIRLTSPGRLSYDGQVDENLLRLLELHAKGETAARMLEEIRALPEFSGDPTLPDRIEALVRELVHHGLLVPGGGEEPA